MSQDVSFSEVFTTAFGPDLNRALHSWHWWILSSLSWD